VDYLGKTPLEAHETIAGIVHPNSQTEANRGDINIPTAKSGD
jgi:hypothetical protein